MLILLCHKPNRINIKALVTIFNSLILSKIQYSMIPFLHSSSKIKADLQILQNKCLKSILNVPIQTSTDLIHKNLKVEKLEQRISKLCSNYIKNSLTFNISISTMVDQFNSRHKIYKNTVLEQINIY